MSSGSPTTLPTSRGFSTRRSCRLPRASLRGRNECTANEAVRMTVSVHARRRRSVLLLALAAALAALVGGLATVPTAAATGGAVKIVVLSNRADLVSGGDALTRVTVPA